MEKKNPKPEEIRALRARHELTQSKLADSLYHITVKAVQEWEAGRRNCPPIIWWAMKLTWDKVDLQRGTVIVEADEAKAGQRILVPLNTAAREILKALPEPHEGRVWGDVTRVWCNTWKASCTRAGVPWLRFHDLRHTWASWHAMAGTPLSVLQELGGWHSPQMVQRYAHLSPEHLAAAAERVSL